MKSTTPLADFYAELALDSQRLGRLLAHPELVVRSSELSGELRELVLAGQGDEVRLQLQAEAQPPTT